MIKTRNNGFTFQIYELNANGKNHVQTSTRATDYKAIFLITSFSICFPLPERKESSKSYLFVLKLLILYPGRNKQHSKLFSMQCATL